MPASRTKIEGAAELKAALDSLGTELSTKIGMRANRSAAKALEAELRDAAPYNPAGPTPKVFTSKSGFVRRTDYGHLRDNLRVTKVRTNRETTIRYVVHTGAAFWGAMREFGTVKAPARPWWRPALDRMRDRLLTIQIEELRRGIDRTAKRLAKGRAVAYPREIEP